MTQILGRKPKAKQKVAVLVLGMHRSGTSMLGGILDRLGCQGPKTELAANQRNPKGYFESAEVMRLNEDIMATLGTRWDDWRGVDPGWQDSPRFGEFRDRIAEVMAAEYGKASLLYLKDPRLCRLLPLWREALTEIGFTPVCIHTHRNPADVAQSLVARVNIPVLPKQAMLVWLRHILDAEAASRGLPRVFTSYGQLLTEWDQVSSRAEQAFGFSWPVLRQAREARLQELIDPSLRHNDSSIDSLLRSSSVPKPVKDCLRVMERWADFGEDPAGRDELGRIAAEFDASAALFGGAIAELGARVKQTEAHSAEELTVLRQGYTALEQERDSLLAQDMARQHELVARAEELSGLRQGYAALEQERDRLQAQERAQQHELAARTEELRQASQRLVQLRAEADLAAQDLQDGLSGAKAEAAAARAELEEAQRQTTALLAMTERLQAELQDLAAAQTQGTAETYEAEVTELRHAQAKLAAEAEEKARAYEAEVTDLRAEQVRLKAEATRKTQVYESELTQLTGVLVERDKRAVQMRKEFEAQLRAEAAALRQAADDRLAALNQDYTSSTSWRLSAPVRSVGRWLKRHPAEAPAKG